MRDPAASVWIDRFAEPPGTGSATVAVKDLIDVAGSITTGACRALAERHEPAEADAACIRAVRAGGGRLLGKTNLHELAFGTSGVNAWYGTPENPSDPGRVPGGSSSGSAVAVAIGEADLALGSDTGGSVRIPAACCGIVGLKTTHGRVPLDGVYPLAPSFDTVGPLAASVAGVAKGLRLLLGEEANALEAEPRVARAVLGPGVEIDPVIDAAVDAALAAAELEVSPVAVEGWAEACRAQQILLGLEALQVNGWLLEASGGVGIGEDILERFNRSGVDAATEASARETARHFVPAFLGLVERAGFLALPTLRTRPPLVGEHVAGFNLLTAPINLAGLPAISVPVPAEGRPPTGLQLVGPPGSEERLVALAARVEAAVAAAG